jgi:transcription antitermination protein NusB
VSARRKARKRALDFLFEAELRGTSALALYRSRPSDDLSQENYVISLLEGVAAHLERLDELIITYSEGWDMDRMPVIDRNLLRLAIYEILWQEKVDEKVAINEAVEMASELSTRDSSRYINGVLGRIVAIKSSLI